MPTTWNPSDKSSSHTLSNSDLTVVHSTNDNSYATTRSLNSALGGSSKKAYWEINWTSFTDAGQVAIGIANGSALLGTGASDNTHWLGNDNNSFGIYPGFNILDSTVAEAFIGGSSVASNLPSWEAGDRVGIAVDFGNKTFWYRVNGGDWNANPTADPATNTGGISFSAIGNVGIFAAIGTRNTGDEITANFGGTAFVDAAPSGFGTLGPVPDLVAEQGTYSLTGFAASLILSGGGNFVLPANAGTYALTGKDTVLTHTPVATTAFFTILDAARSGIGILLSDDRLTAEFDGTTGEFRNTFGTTSKGSSEGGKFAFRVRIEGNVAVGLANDTADASDGGDRWLGWDTNSIGVFPDGNVWFNGADTGLGGDTFGDNDILLFAVDMNTRKWWYKVNAGGDWNGSPSALPNANVGGFDLQFTGNVFAAASIQGSSATFSFIPSDPLPYGFVAWDDYTRPRLVRSLTELIGREPITIVEIEQDLCTRTYGIDPCQAILGVTGEHKCFNTFATCQDTNNYSPKNKIVLRFCTPVDNLPRDLNLFPTIISVSTSPTQVNAGGGDRNVSPLGLRASITVQLRDHPYHDRRVDPYWRERDYDPMEQGSFWSKWRARNRYYAGRNLRIYDGYIGQSLSEMRVRRYVIEKIEGPTRGVATIVAKDPLKLTDADRAQAPHVGSALTTTAIDVEYSDSFDIEPGHRTEYSSSGVGRLDSELFSFDRPGEDTVFFVERGLRDTEVAAHESGITFQEVLVFINLRIDEIIRDLILTFTNLDTTFFNFSEWKAEIDQYLPSLTTTGWIIEPTGVSELLSELTEQAQIMLWWDERAQLIRLKVLRAVTDDDVVRVLTADKHIIEDSLVIQERPDERLTQIWFYYNVIDPLGNLDDPLNFQNRFVAIDESAEGVNEYNDTRIFKIFSRWFGGIIEPGFPASIAMLCNNLLARSRNVPVIMECLVDAKDSDLNVADIVDVQHPDIVDFTGQETTARMQIISVEDIEPGHRVKLRMRSYSF